MALLLVSLLLLQAAEEPRLVAIVAPTSPATTMTMADLRKIYLGTTTRWSDGRRIVPVVLRRDSPEQKTLLKQIVQMTDIDYAQHWIGQVFRGRAAAPPRVVATAAQARRFVAANPHAIAIIAATDADASVRALTIDGL